jgi:putative membrane protein
MPYCHMMELYPHMGLGTSLVWLIAIVVIAYLIYRLIKSEKILAPSKVSIRSAEEILNERYSKGELTREQYLQMKEDLKRSV